MLARMWLVLLVVVQVAKGTLGYTSANMYCADLNPQHLINIDQLMGMWFVIEVISHQPDDEYYVRRVPTCPIVHLSEDRTMGSTHNPLYKDYNYDSNYGHSYDYNYNHRTQAGRSQYDYTTGRYPSTGYTNSYPGGYDPNDRYNRQQDGARSSTPFNPWFSSSTTTPSPAWYGGPSTAYPTNFDFNRLTSGSRYMGRRPQEEWKYLRLWWDEDGSSTEYQLRYNITRAGFWFSSGPNNGSSLSPQYSHFAGAVQVIKAVGDHFVLTFCHSMPERKLFTVILSRETYLDPSVVHGVHNQLIRKALRTDNVQKTCGAGGLHSMQTVFIALALSFLVHNFSRLITT